MNSKNQEKLRKIVIITLGLLITLIAYKTLWSSGNSQNSILNFQTKENRQLAEGLWGELGFYKDSSDNTITFILLGAVLLSIVSKVYTRYVKKPHSK